MSWIMMGVMGGLIGMILGFCGLNIFMWQFWVIDIPVLIMIMIANGRSK